MGKGNRGLRGSGALALIGLVACAHASSTGDAETGSASVPPQPQAAEGPAAEGAAAPTSAHAAGDGSGDVSGHMQANFRWALQARDAIIEGRLERARAYARKLRDQGAWPGFPADWKPFLEGMRQRVEEIVLSGSMEEAATAVGRLGIRCGDCHWYSEQGPDVPRTPPMAFEEWKDTPEPVDARMRRHDVGVAQMWLGLIQPSEQAWRDGTITLTRASLKSPARDGEPVGELELAAFERVRALAKQARVAGSHDQRAEVYGALLVQCAACHEAPPR